MKQIAIFILFSLFILTSIKSFGNDQAETYYNKGMRLIESRMWEEAEKALSKAIELNKKFDAAYNARGGVRIQLNNLEGALEDLSMAIEIDPYFENALTNRGSVWVAKGDYEKAKSDFETVLRFNPNSISALYNRGHAHVKLGQEFHLAVADYLRILDLDPYHEGARNNLTLTRQAISQRSERCLQNFEKLVDIFTPPEPPPMSLLDFLNPFKRW